MSDALHQESSLQNIEEKIAYIREYRRRGGQGYTFAVRDCASLIELALRELINKYLMTLKEPAYLKFLEEQQKIGEGKKTYRAFTMGQLVGVIRTSRFFDALAEVLGMSLSAIRMLDLDRIVEIRNKTVHGDYQARAEEADILYAALKAFLLSLGIIALDEEQTPSPRPDTTLTSEPGSVLASPASSERDAIPAGVIPSAVRRIALIYKRNAKPDDHVLDLLEHALTANGYDVFIDRHLTIGEEWARAIDRQIRDSDAVVALLSASAFHSEMLEYELTAAHDAARSNGGRPRLLPIRIAYEGPFPPVLARLLNPLHYTLWQSDADDTRLVDEVLRALRAPPPPRPDIGPIPLGGAVPLDSFAYIERPVDTEFNTAIHNGDSIVLVKGARQMGKTSILARGLKIARDAGARVVFTDFQSLEQTDFESKDAFYRQLALSLKLGLDLDVKLARIWDNDLTPAMNLHQFLSRTVLQAVTGPLVWGMDEVDRLFACTFGGDVFALFRSWHNRRATDPEGPWSRLTLAIAYATEAHLFITDVNQSPFNVGTRITLDDFTLGQVIELNRRYSTPLTDKEVVRFHDLLHGQPYLVQRGLDLLVHRNLSYEELESTADRDEGIYGDHLRRILVLLARNEELLKVVRSLLRGQSCPDDESFYRLRSAGIYIGDSRTNMRPRCGLYQSYLASHLL